MQEEVRREEAGKAGKQRRSEGRPEMGTETRQDRETKRGDARQAVLAGIGRARPGRQWGRTRPGGQYGATRS
jgi:hypothetical protein